MAKSSRSTSPAEAGGAARFRDPQRQVYDFADVFLVECPRCRGCACIEAGRENRHRLTCRACGYNEQTGEHPSTIIGGPFDWYFQLPLWLALPCCGECLWAYNGRHLDLLENYVAAKLRERPRVVQSDFGPRNKTLVSRLPSWMKQAGNRARILETIVRLRARLPEWAR